LEKLLRWFDGPASWQQAETWREGTGENAARPSIDGLISAGRRRGFCSSALQAGCRARQLGEPFSRAARNPALQGGAGGFASAANLNYN